MKVRAKAEIGQALQDSWFAEGRLDKARAIAAEKKAKEDAAKKLEDDDISEAKKKEKEANVPL